MSFRELRLFSRRRKPRSLRTRDLIWRGLRPKRRHCDDHAIEANFVESRVCRMRAERDPAVACLHRFGWPKGGRVGDQLIRVYDGTAVNTGYYTFSYGKEAKRRACLRATVSLTSKAASVGLLLTIIPRPCLRPRNNTLRALASRMAIPAAAPLIRRGRQGGEIGPRSSPPSPDQVTPGAPDRSRVSSPVQNPPRRTCGSSRRWNGGHALG